MGKKRLKIYPSIEKMSEDEARYAATLTPVQCWKETVELIGKVYPKRVNSKKITIKKRN